MGEKQKLDIACEILKQTIKKVSVTEDVNKRWELYARRGSIQSRKAKNILRR